MAVTKKDRFWRGPVTSEGGARSIISVTGWVFVALGGLPMLTLLTARESGTSGAFGTVFAGVLLAAPAAFLLNRKARAPALILLGLSGLTAVLSFGVGMTAIRTSIGMAFGLLAISLVWVTLTVLCWRAFVATSALRNIRSRPAPSVAEVFE